MDLILMFALGTLFGSALQIFYPMPINRQKTKEVTPSATHNKQSDEIIADMENYLNGRLCDLDITLSESALCKGLLHMINRQ